MMGEYVKRSDALQAVGDVHPLDYNGQGIVERIKGIPAADVVEVVRCAECKYAKPWYWDKSRCFLWHDTGIDVFNDGYCNYGERKDGGQEE